MKTLKEIIYFFIKRKKIIFSLLMFLFLTACNEDEEESQCPTIQANMSSGDAFLNSFFDMLVTSATSLANNAWGKCAGALAPAVLCVTAIYIAWNTLKVVASAGEKTVGSYISDNGKGVAYILAKGVVIYTCLTSQCFQQWFLFPFLSLGAGIAAAFSGGKLSASGGSWSGIFTAIKSVAQTFNTSTQTVVGIGSSLVCHATEGTFILGWDFFKLIYGIILFIFGWFLTISMCAYMADIIIRLAISASLLALGIALAVSNITSDYSKKIWNTYVNIFFSLIIAGMVLKITDIVIGDSVGANSGLQGAIDGDDPGAIMTGMIGLGKFITGIISICIIINLTEQMNNLSDELADTNVSESTSPTSQTAGSKLKGPAKAARRAVSRTSQKFLNKIDGKKK